MRSQLLCSSKAQAAFAACAFALVSYPFALAQAPDTVWTQIYPKVQEDCYGERLIRTSDGGYLIGGHRMITDSDYFVVKTDSTGEMEWARTYGIIVPNQPGQWDVLGGIGEGEGGYYLSGLWAHGRYAHIMKIDFEGDTVWSKTYSEDEFYDLTVDRNGNVIAAGTTDEFSRFGSSDGWLLKVNSDGEIVSNWVYGGGGTDLFTRIICTSDGGYLAVGETRSWGGHRGYVVKIDSRGRQQWSVALQGAISTAILGATEVPNGGFFVVGSTNLGGDLEFYCVRLASNGDTFWAKRWGSERAGIDRLFDVVCSPGGGFLVVGQDDRFRQAAIRLDDDGETLWEMHIERGSWPYSSVLVNEDGSYTIAGTRFVLPYGEQAWLIRTEPDPLYNSVTLLDPALPSRFVIGAPYPNPFNSSVRLDYSLSKPSYTSIRIYNQLGHQVAKLYNGRLEAGEHLTNWNATELPSGVYLCRLEAGGINRTAKLTLIR